MQPQVLEAIILPAAGRTDKCASTDDSLNETNLQGLARRANKIPQYSDIRAIGADSPGVDGKTEALGQIQVYSSVVEFRKAESLRWRNSVKATRINRPWRTVALPRTARQLIKLHPIAFVPSRHSLQLLRCSLLLPSTF